MDSSDESRVLRFMAKERERALLAETAARAVEDESLSVLEEELVARKRAEIAASVERRAPASKD